MVRRSSVSRGREAVPAGMLIYRISDPVVDPEEAAKAGPEKAAERKLRMDGLVNADAEILTHMDRSLREEGTRSSVIPAGLKKGAPDGYTPAVSTEDFAVIRAYAGKRIAADLAAIQSGSARILPVREGEFTACSYCPYRAVCGFDRRLPEYNYRKIRPKKDDAALEGMKHEVFG